VNIDIATATPHNITFWKDFAKKKNDMEAQACPEGKLNSSFSKLELARLLISSFTFKGLGREKITLRMDTVKNMANKNINKLMPTLWYRLSPHQASKGTRKKKNSNPKNDPTRIITSKGTERNP